MHRPSSREILKDNQSYYSLVIAVAKRAREITNDAEISGFELIEKPVKLAVEEFSEGEYLLIESDTIGEIIDIKKYDDAGILFDNDDEIGE